jgi:hypothetical protein
MKAMINDAVIAAAASLTLLELPRPQGLRYRARRPRLFRLRRLSHPIGDGASAGRPAKYVVACLGGESRETLRECQEPGLPSPPGQIRGALGSTHL